MSFINTDRRRSQILAVEIDSEASAEFEEKNEWFNTYKEIQETGKDLNKSGIQRMREEMRHRKESASQIAFNKDNMILTENVLDEIFDRGKNDKPIKPTV